MTPSDCTTEDLFHHQEFQQNTTSKYNHSISQWSLVSLQTTSVVCNAYFPVPLTAAARSSHDDESAAVFEWPRGKPDDVDKLCHCCCCCGRPATFPDAASQHMKSSSNILIISAADFMTHLAKILTMNTSAKEVISSSAFVCLLAGLCKKLLDRFSTSSLERWHTERGRNDQMLVLSYG